MTEAVATKLAPKAEPAGPYIIKREERVLFNQVACFHSVQARQAGLKLEDLEKPATWGAIAQHIRPMDHLFVTDNELTFWAHCVVIDADRGQATVKVVSSFQIPKASREWEARVPDGFRIYRSTIANEGYVIERKRDAKVIGTGFKSGGAALEDLLQRSMFSGR